MSPAKKRKPLDPTAAGFVFGAQDEVSKPQEEAEAIADDEDDEDDEVIEPEPEAEPARRSPAKSAKKPEGKQTSIMEQLMEATAQKEPTTRITADLPNSMHRKLSILAARTGRKKVEIIRMLLQDALKDVED